MFKDLLTLGQNPSDAERQRVIRIFEHEIRTSDRGDVIESCKRGLRLFGIRIQCQALKALPANKR